MNNLKTTDLGGFRVYLNDLRWVDASVRDALKGIMSAFNIANNETFILSGCGRSVVAGVAYIEAGYVSIAGEICHVPAHNFTAAISTEIEYWTLVSAFDPQGYKEFQNSTLVDTYEIRVAKVVVAASLPAGFSLYDEKVTIHQWIVKKYTPDAWTIFKTQIIPPSEAFPGTHLWRCKKDLGGFVHLEGVVSIEDPDNFNAIATLPAGFRPAKELEFGISIFNDSTVTSIFQILVVKPNGDMIFKSVAGLPFVGLYNLGQITPFMIGV